MNEQLVTIAGTSRIWPGPHVEHVLVPLDGSERALRAMPTARVLAQRFGATLHTVSVANADDVARLRASASAALGVDERDDHVDVVTDGDPADVIAHRASALGSSLVCMATQGRGRFRGALIGSVARSLLQRSIAPIVALGPEADKPGWSPRPQSWPEPLSEPRIVACVDGTDPSEQVLPLAASWANALDMSLTILTVIDDVPPPIQPDNRFGREVDAESYIEDLVQRWSGTVTEVDGVVVRDPISPAAGVRAHLDRRPAGLVAVTTHARAGMQRALFGAQAANIVHASVAPCLVAPVR